MAKTDYNFQAIEKKWQDKWEKEKIFEVKEDDTEETMSQRILKEEHKMYSRAITLFFENRLKIIGRKVIISVL